MPITVWWTRSVGSWRIVCSSLAVKNFYEGPSGELGFVPLSVGCGFDGQILI